MTIDIHLSLGIGIHYLRVPLDDTDVHKCFFSRGTVQHIAEGNEFGTLLRVKHNDRLFTVWLQSTYGPFRFDNNKRITESDESSLSYRWDFKPDIRLDISMSGNTGDVVIIPYVVMEDPDEKFYEEVRGLNDIERRLYRKTDWFFASTPKDIWNYLINGSIYDPRSEKGVEKRFRCQQCAYAWWSYFGFLFKETGKKIYHIFQDEIAYSILLDMSEKGEWGHGYNTDDMETHTRFHLDGIHLLISQYEKTNESMWLESAKRGMTFFFEHLVEKFDDKSLWFLHDTIEHKKLHHFKTSLFGKSTGNALIINTHVQALTVLRRLHILCKDDKLYSEMFEKGMRALHRVLDYQPGDVIYRLLLLLVMKYKKMVSARSITGKLKNASITYIVPVIYWFIRRTYPRFVYPGGFIERDLTRCFFSDRYHIINIKDLLTLYKQIPVQWMSAYIKNGVSFIHKYLAEISLEKALERSPYYIELIDILYMYDKLFEHIDTDQIRTTEEIIYQQTGGYSLDYYASELVHGKDIVENTLQ